MTNKIHTGHPDCCADCELQEAIKAAHEGSLKVAGVKPAKRTWFISYSWSAYSAGDRERLTGFGNVYKHHHLGHVLSQSDVREMEEELKQFHKPKNGSPEDKVTIVVLNIVEIDPE